MDHNLLQKLKEWRKTTADAEGVEAFRVFPNSVLDAIAEFKPVDKDGLFAIKGIRERKYDKYGADLLALIHGSNGTGVAKIPLDNVTGERDGNDPLSVSDYLDLLNVQMRSCSARIQGEISSLDIRERVLYFSLKDSTDGSIINCIMWKNAYDLSGVAFEIGLEVILEGAPDIYKSNGRLSFKTLSAELVGEGALKKAYDLLKKKLEAEGLFAVERKKSLPDFPQKIGLITSKDSAAIGDFQMNLGQFGFQVKLIDSRVEGQLAVSELLSAIRLFRGMDIEVLVLLRGGGSLESLLPFNNETLVREIVDFPVPVLVGVGHERDISLVGLVADKMVSTPTAAAQALNESWQEALSKVQLQQYKLLTRFERDLAKRRAMLVESLQIIRDRFQTIFDNFNRVENGFSRISASLQSQMAQMRRLLNERPNILRREMRGLVHRTHSHISAIFRTSLNQMAFALKDAQKTVLLDEVLRTYVRILGSTKKDIFSIEKMLETHNPERQLKLGYSIVRSNDSVIRNVQQLVVGQAVEVRMHDGSFKSDVTDITKGV